MRQRIRLSWKKLEENPTKNECTLTNQCFERTIQFFQIRARNWIQKRPAIGVPRLRIHEDEKWEATNESDEYKGSLRGDGKQRMEIESQFLVPGCCAARFLALTRRCGWASDHNAKIETSRENITSHVLFWINFGGCPRRPDYAPAPGSSSVVQRWASVGGIRWTKQVCDSVDRTLTLTMYATTSAKV